MDMQPFEPEVLVSFFEEPSVFEGKQPVIRNRNNEVIGDPTYWMTNDGEYIVAGLNHTTQKLEVFDKNNFHHLTLEWADVTYEIAGDQHD